jgi:hypothetical protein
VRLTEDLSAAFKGIKPFFALLIGAAAAIPGMSALQQLELPQEAGSLFSFIFTAFSAAAVLLAYLLRRQFSGWPIRRVAVAASFGLILVLGAYLTFVWLLSIAWVSHIWRAEPSRDFVPFFLPHEADSLIKAAGSRSQLLSRSGPDVLLPYISEASSAATLALLIVSYTVLIVLAASVFSMLYFRASAEESRA